MSDTDPKPASREEPADTTQPAEAQGEPGAAKAARAQHMSYWARKMRQYLPEPQATAADSAGADTTDEASRRTRG